jgi:hypothetical protein
VDDFSEKWKEIKKAEQNPSFRSETTTLSEQKL